METVKVPCPHCEHELKGHPLKVKTEFFIDRNFTTFKGNQHITEYECPHCKGTLRVDVEKHALIIEAE